MTHDTYSSAPSRAPCCTFRARSLAVQAAAATAPPGPADLAWCLGYVAVSLLAIAAAGVIACGETASAELRMVTAVVRAAPLVQDICSTNGDPKSGAVKQACVNTHEHRIDATGAC